jgi:hypothetical protein
VRPKWFSSLWYIQRKTTSLSYTNSNTDFLSLWYVRCNSCTYLASEKHYIKIGQNELSLQARHLGVPSGASKMISEPRLLGVPSGASKTIPGPMVCLAQTVDLSCTDTNTVSKLTEMRLDMTHVT